MELRCLNSLFQIMLVFLSKQSLGWLGLGKGRRMPLKTLLGELSSINNIGKYLHTLFLKDFFENLHLLNDFSFKTAQNYLRQRK